MTAARHPNRTGLRATTQAADAGAVPVLACRCPVTVVSGTTWAYDARMGWHDPVEHATWTPPLQPPRAALPAKLQAWTGPTSGSEAAGPQGRAAPAGRRHTLAPAGRGLVVCTACGLVFDAAACTRSGRPLPACELPTRPMPATSPAASTVNGDTGGEELA